MRATLVLWVFAGDEVIFRVDFRGNQDLVSFYLLFDVQTGFGMETVFL